MSKINEAQIFLSYRLFGAGTIALALRLGLPVTLAAQNQGGRAAPSAAAPLRSAARARWPACSFGIFRTGVSFAADSGALFAGALAAFGCLIVIARAGMSPLVAPILFFPLLADALLTLLYRARRDRSLLVAHAEYLYQSAIISGWSHARIALTYWLAMAFCGAIGWVANRDDTDTVPAVALTTLVAGAVALDVIVRRRAEAAGILKR